MAQTMTASLKIPHFGYCDEIRMDGLMELRKRMKHLAEEKGVKLSYLPFMIKAASMGLKKYPILNSSINESLTEITFKVRFRHLIQNFLISNNNSIRLHTTSVSLLILLTVSSFPILRTFKTWAFSRSLPNWTDWSRLLRTTNWPRTIWLAVLLACLTLVLLAVLTLSLLLSLRR